MTDMSQLTRGLKPYAPKMLQQALYFSFQIFVSIFTLLPVCTANSNIYVQCSQHYFTSTTPYESNVNSLFTSFVNSASISNFNKFEISHPDFPQSDIVYGLFQCQGDLSSSNCKDCVANSVSQLKTTCSYSTGGGIQLDGCFVKYDNSSFFGTEDKMEMFKRCGPSVGYNSDVLNRIDGALEYLISGNGQYFRGGNFGSIQGMAQCVQDLSVSDCQDCLSEASGRLRSECETSTWGDMYLGKCYMRYVDQGTDGHDAYNGNSSSNKSRGGGSNNNIMKWIGYIIAAAVAGGGLTFAAKNCCNINVYNIVKKMGRDLEETKKDVESFKTEAKTASKKADEADKKADEAEKKADVAQKEAQEAKMYGPYEKPYPYSYPYPYRYPYQNQCSYL